MKSDLEIDHEKLVAKEEEKSKEIKTHENQDKKTESGITQENKILMMKNKL